MMPWPDYCIVRQSEYFINNRVHDLPVPGAAEIYPAESFREERIAGEYMSLCVQAYASLCVPRCLDNLQSYISYFDCVAVAQKPFRKRGAFVTHDR